MKLKNSQTKKVILYNLLGLAIALIVCYYCFRGRGYSEGIYIVEGDYHFAHRNSNLPLEDRYAARMAGFYTFLRYVRENTPEDAVIYLPSAEAFIEDAWGELFFSYHCANKFFATRFLYPRKVVTAREYAQYGSSLPLTHVIVVGSGGRDILPYEIGDTTCVILPIKKTF